MAEEPAGSTTGEGAGQATPGQATPGQATPGQATPGQTTPGQTTAGKKATPRKTTTRKATKAPAAKKASRPTKRVPAPSVEQGPVETTSSASSARSATAPAAKARTRPRKVPAPSVEQGPVETTSPPGAAGERAQDAATGLLALPLEAMHMATVTAGKTVQLVGLPVTAARAVLDRKGGLPAYLGAGALAVVGVIEWPAAVGASAGYAALRRWGDRLPEPLRTLTGSRPVEPSAREWDEG